MANTNYDQFQKMSDALRQLSWNSSLLPVCHFNDTNESCPAGTFLYRAYNYCFTAELNFDALYPDLQHAELMYGHLYAFLAALTIVANAFVALVLSKRHMSSPTNTILLYMSAADLCVALVPFPFLFLFFVLAAYEQPNGNVSQFWCWLFTWAMDALPSICHNIAIWLTVLLAAQRYVYIRFPTRAQWWCTLANVRLATVGVVLVSAIAGCPKLFVYEAFLPFGTNDTYVCDPHTLEFHPRTTSFGCVAAHTPFYHLVTEDIFFTVYYTVRILFFVLIPSLLLIALNTLLIIGIRKANLRHQQLLRDACLTVESSQKQLSTSKSVMLVLIVTIFLLVNLPQGVLLTLITLNAMVFRSGFLTPMVIFWIMAVDNLLILATYPLNFAIYCGMSKQFRETFKGLFCERLEPISNSMRRLSSHYVFSTIQERSGRKCSTDNTSKMLL